MSANPPDWIWPVTLQAGVIVPGLWRGNGYLTIEPGRLRCTPGQILSFLGNSSTVVHQGPEVDIFVGRLIPPWFNVSIPIRGTENLLIATRWIVGLRKVVRTLEAAGYSVKEHRTWVDRGFRWAEMRGTGQGDSRSGSP